MQAGDSCPRESPVPMALGQDACGIAVFGRLLLTQEQPWLR